MFLEKLFFRKKGGEMPDEKKKSKKSSKRFGDVQKDGHGNQEGQCYQLNARWPSSLEDEVLSTNLLFGIAIFADREGLHYPIPISVVPLSAFFKKGIDPRDLAKSLFKFFDEKKPLYLRSVKFYALLDKQNKIQKLSNNAELDLTDDVRTLWYELAGSKIEADRPADAASDKTATK